MGFPVYNGLCDTSGGGGGAGGWVMVVLFFVDNEDAISTIRDLL